MIAYQYWLGLDSATREKLANQFGVRASGGTEVMDGRVIRDRYSPQDVSLITCEKMCEFAGIKTKDIYEALEATINKLNDVQPKEEAKEDQGAESQGSPVAVAGVETKARATRGSKKGASQG
jgi:hypothetical protein